MKQLTVTVNLKPSIDMGSEGLNEAGWVLLREIQKYQHIEPKLWNNLKGCLKVAIEKYIECQQMEVVK